MSNEEIATSAQVVPQPATDRLNQVEGYYLDMASHPDHLQPATQEYIEAGGSIRLCLAEILRYDQGRPPGQLEQDRQAYLSRVISYPPIRGRASRRHDIDILRDRYVKDVVGQVGQIVNASTPEDALAARQLPTLVQGTSFNENGNPSLEDFSANHLYILIDTALREHAARRKLIAEHSSNSPIARTLDNRILRMSVAGSVFVASVSPDLHFIPIDNQEIARNVQIGLEVISATVFGYEAPEEVRWRYLDIIHAKRTIKLHEQLAASKRMSDLALRMTYNASRYAGVGDNVAIDCAASADKEENLRRFAKLDDNFKHLNNDPGGKPYTGDQALGYAARLLIERRKQINNIVANDKTVDQRKQQYLKLVEDIVEEDLRRMEKGLSTSHIRQAFWRMIGIAPAILFPVAVSTFGGAADLGEDVESVGKPEEQQVES